MQQLGHARQCVFLETLTLSLSGRIILSLKCGLQCRRRSDEEVGQWSES